VTGPLYPPGPQYGSNGVGLFQIGVSPVGLLPQFDVWRTILSQYANSPRIVALIENMFEYVDQTRNIEQFYDMIMSLDTAVGYGLDVWGRIVGINRVIQVPAGEWLGFEEQLPTVFTFGQGVWYSGDPLTANYALSDEAYRLLIIAKAMANITDGSIPSINRILMSLFPNRGNAYVAEGAPTGEWWGFSESSTGLPFNQGVFYTGADVPYMTMTYTFEFTLSPVELAIVTNSGVLPKPVGVAASVAVLA